MIIIRTKLTLSQATQLGKTGKTEDINFLMEQLSIEAPIAICKLIDHAINQIKSPEGILRLKHYIFNGTDIQRKYAALYFKRKKEYELLKEAVKRNCIDHEFAFCR